LILKLDPRVKTPALSCNSSPRSRQLYDETLAVQKVLAQLRALRARSADQGAKARRPTAGRIR
jgi:hypothetical protein